MLKFQKSQNTPVCVLLIGTPVAGSPDGSGTGCCVSVEPLELTR